MQQKLKVFAVPRDGIQGWACGYRISKKANNRYHKSMIIWQDRRGTKIYYRFDFRNCFPLETVIQMQKFKIGGHNMVSKLANKFLLSYTMWDIPSSSDLCKLAFAVTREAVYREFFKPPSASQPIRFMDQSSNLQTPSFYIKDMKVCDEK